MAMSAHVVYSAIDAASPATTSPIVVKEIMREAIGFDGLILSDDLSMKALGGPFARTRRAPSSPPASTSRCTATAILPRRARSPRRARNLPAPSLRRAEAALARIAGGPQPFDVAAARAELEAMMRAASAA